MSFKQFVKTEFENSKNTYAKEVKERWGETPGYKQSEENANI